MGGGHNRGTEEVRDGVAGFGGGIGALANRRSARHSVRESAPGIGIPEGSAGALAAQTGARSPDLGFRAGPGLRNRGLQTGLAQARESGHVLGRIRAAGRKRQALGR